MEVLMVFGTRPEAIKPAQVIQELRKHNDKVMCKVCVTEQNRQMLDQVLRLFDITSNYDLNILGDNQFPIRIVSVIAAQLEPILKKERPDWALVQGGTTTEASDSLARRSYSAKVALPFTQ